jgi:hypothetical protein
MKRLLLLITMGLLVGAASAADVTTLAPSTTTDWNLWILSGAIGLVLFLLSLRATASPAENEMDIVISFMAWAPIAFCANASFAVSRVIAAGTVTVYAYWQVGVIMWVFFIVAILNTIRLIAMHSVLKGNEQQNRGLRNE